MLKDHFVSRLSKYDRKLGKQIGFLPKNRSTSFCQIVRQKFLKLGELFL